MTSHSRQPAAPHPAYPTTGTQSLQQTPKPAAPRCGRWRDRVVW